MPNLYLLAAIAALGAALIGGAYYHGRTSQQSEAIEVRNRIIKERIETNATVNRLDDGGLCAALNGRVLPNGECE